MTSGENPTRSRVTALAGIVGISFSAIFVRLADVSPSTAAFYRTFLAIGPLLLLRLAARNDDGRGARDRLLAVAAGLFLAIDLALWHRAIDDIGAGLATVLANTQVVFVAIAAWLIHRERPTRLALAVIPVVFAGVVLISGLGRLDAYGDDPVRGVVHGTLAGVSYSLFLLLFRRSNRSLAAPAGPLLDATVGAFAGSLLLAPLDRQFDIAVSPGSLVWLTLLALVAQVAGWLLIAVALPRLAALDTSVLLLLQPMMTVLWGVLVFREDLSSLQWTGVALVMGGIGTLLVGGSSARTASD